MKKIIKRYKFLFGILIGIIFTSTITYAAMKCTASEVSYKDGSVESALNYLYDKANNKSSSAFCILLSGTKETIGAKYACNPGDGIVYYFYVLAVDDNNIKLIMEQNLSDTVGSATMTWNEAKTFFDSGNPGYTIGQKWLTKVKNIDLPSAQDIANAGEITEWDVTKATKDDWSYLGVNSQSDTSRRNSYTWLYNYTRGCLLNGCSSGYPNSVDYPYGYWTKDLIQNDKTMAWCMNAYSGLGNRALSSNSEFGIRPVITVSKSDLAS